MATYTDFFVGSDAEIGRTRLALCCSPGRPPVAAEDVTGTFMLRRLSRRYRFAMTSAQLAPESTPANAASWSKARRGTKVPAHRRQRCTNTLTPTMEWTASGSLQRGQ